MSFMALHLSSVILSRSESGFLAISPPLLLVYTLQRDFHEVAVVGSEQSELPGQVESEGCAVLDHALRRCDRTRPRHRQSSLSSYRTGIERVLRTVSPLLYDIARIAEST